MYTIDKTLCIYYNVISSKTMMIKYKIIIFYLKKGYTVIWRVSFFFCSSMIRIIDVYYLHLSPVT